MTFELPMITMMVVLELYTIIDAMIIGLIEGMGIMLATGGNTVISKNMGAGEGASGKRGCLH